MALYQITNNQCVNGTCAIRQIGASMDLGIIANGARYKVSLSAVQTIVNAATSVSDLQARANSAGFLWLAY